mgnify:CR=1 FL=1
MFNRCIITALMLFTIPLTATEICAHRGDVTHAPENTLIAIRTAIAKGAAMVEFDVYTSKDGELIIIHDATVDRTTEATGKVTDFTFDELRKLNAADYFESEDIEYAKIPTLREVLELVPRDVLCNVHLKNSPGVAAKSAKVIEELGRLDHCFLACSEEQIAEARAVVSEIKTCNMSRQTGNRGAYIDMTIELGCQFIQLQHSQGTEGLKEDVDRLHEAGVLVNFYGANEVELMQTLADAGIDYVLTDKLDIARMVLDYRPYISASHSATVSVLSGTIAFDLQYPIFTFPEQDDWNETLNTFIQREMLVMQTGFTQDMTTWFASIMGDARDLGVTETHAEYSTGPFAVTLYRPGLLSMRMFTWFYSGGAHGLSSISTYTLRLKGDGTLETLGFDDVFLPYDNVLPSLSHLLIGGLREQSASLVITESLTAFIKDDFPNFALEELGIRFYFDPYHAGSYAEGSFEVLISYDNLKDFMSLDLLSRIQAKAN